MPGGDDLRPGHSGVKLTYDDYVLFPEDGQRHELIDGEHYVTPAPNWRHQTIVASLLAMIWAHLQHHRCGRVLTSPFDVILSHLDVVQPDVLYVSHERLAQLESSPCLKGAPNLVVEVGSPSTRKRDRSIKRRLYERFGIDEYWLVDPEANTVRVFRHHHNFYRLEADLALERGDVVTTPLLPNLELPLMKIFED